MAELRAGVVLGERFTVVGVLGRGGTATVYLVEDALRGEAIALKILHPHLAASASMRMRLRREVASAARLRHARALVAWDLHDLDGQLAISMPLHSGHTLAEHVARHGPLTAHALERLADQLADVLGAAHALGLVHRDVTPRNILIDDDGDAVLSDFGLARFVDAATATGTGALGTLGYAAPEGWSGVRADPRADLYGLGAVLHLAATGTPPFGAGDPVGVFKRQLAGDREALATARPDLPPYLGALIDRLLAVEPEDRPPCATEVRAILASRQLAAQAPSEAPSRRVDAPSALGAPHQLPVGEFTVVVSERASDRDRRAAARRGRTASKGRFEQDVSRAFDTLSRKVMVDWLGIPPSSTPEDRLIEAVRRAASLPPDALVAPSSMMERRFRLVECVDHPTAMGLARATLDAGFLAEVVAVTALEERTGPNRWLAAIRLVVFLAVGLVGSAMVTATFASVWPALAFIVFVLGVAVTMLSILDPVRALTAPIEPPAPIAFGRDLRLHLAPDADVALPPPSALPVRTGPPSAEQASNTTSQELPAEAPPAPTRTGALVARTEAQVASLMRAIEEVERLPAPARVDLRSTARELAERVDGLGRRAEALESLVVQADEATLAAAVDRIEARLARLSTLNAAGRGEHDAEIQRLTASLDAHREGLANAEATEGQLTLVIARLLEVGATASRVRAEVIGQEPTEGSFEDLGRRLQQQARASADALRSVGRS